MAEMTPIPPDMQPIQPEQASGTPYISDRFRADAVAADDAPPANYTFAGICSIVAFILFAVVLVILIQDWNFLKVA